MVVSLFLTHLLLEVTPLITFTPSTFHCHWSSRSKRFHWWRRSKAYKLHMELHPVVSRASSSRWRSFASSIFLFGQFTLIPCFSSSSPCISSIVLIYFYPLFSFFFSFHNLRELNSSKILDRVSLWLVPSPLTLDERWLMLVPKLWFFHVEGLQKVKARVQKN